MKLLKWLLVLFSTLLVLLIVGLVVLLVSPGLQKSIVTSLLNHDEQTASVDYFKAGLGSVEIENLQLENDAMRVAIAETSGSFALLSFLTGTPEVDSLRIDDLIVTLKETDAEKEESEDEPEAFEGIFEELEDVNFQLSELDINGEIRLPTAQTVTFELSGGDFAPSAEGTLDLSLVYRDQDQAELAWTGTLAVSQKDGGIQSLGAASTLKASGPQLPADEEMAVNISLERVSPNEESYRLSIRQPGADDLLTVSASFDQPSSELSYEANVAATHAEVGPYVVGTAIPDFQLSAKLSGGANLQKQSGELKSDGTLKLSNLGKLDPQLQTLPPMNAVYEIDANFTPSEVLLSTMKVTIDSQAGSRLLEMSALQNLRLTKKASGWQPEEVSGELVSLNVQQLPLIWADPFMAGLSVTNGQISGQVRVATDPDKSIRLSTQQPIQISNFSARNADGEMLRNVFAQLSTSVDYGQNQANVNVSSLNLQSQGQTLLAGGIEMDAANLDSSPLVEGNAKLQGSIGAILAQPLATQAGLQASGGQFSANMTFANAETDGLSIKDGGQVSVQGLTLSQNGKALLRNLSLSASPVLSLRDERLDATLNNLNVMSGSTLASGALSAKAEELSSGEMTANFDLQGDLAALLAQPVLASRNNVSRGQYSAKGEASTLAEGGASGSIDLTLSNMVLQQPRESLPFYRINMPFTFKSASDLNATINATIAEASAQAGSPDFKLALDIKPAGENKQVSGSLTGREVDLDAVRNLSAAFRDPNREKTPSTKETPWEGYRGSIEMDVDRLVVNKIPASDVSTEIVIDEGGLNFAKPLQAGIVGAPLQISGKLPTTDGKVGMDLQFSLSGLDTKKLGEAMGTTIPLRTGVSIKGSLAGNDEDFSALLSSMDYSLDFRAAKGELPFLSQEKDEMNQIMSLLNNQGTQLLSSVFGGLAGQGGSSGQSSVLSKATSAIDALRVLSIEEMSFSAKGSPARRTNIQDFRLINDKLQLLGNADILHQEGVSFLQQQLQGEMKLNAKGTLGEVLQSLKIVGAEPNDAGYLLGNTFRVGGTVSEPSYVAFADLLQQSLLSQFTGGPGGGSPLDLLRGATRPSQGGSQKAESTSEKAGDATQASEVDEASRPRRDPAQEAFGIFNQIVNEAQRSGQNSQQDEDAAN